MFKVIHIKYGEYSEGKIKNSSHSKEITHKQAGNSRVYQIRDEWLRILFTSCIREVDKVVVKESEEISGESRVISWVSLPTMPHKATFWG